MFCSNCGNELSNDAKFCSNCGHKAGEAPSTPVTATPAERIVTIKREGIFGAGPMRVLIDDSEFCAIFTGETKSFPIPNGSHRMQIKCTSTAISHGRTSQNQYYSDVVFINAEDSSLNFSATLNFLGKIVITKK